MKNKLLLRGSSTLSRPLFAVIVDDLRVKAWQAAALATIAPSFDFVVLNCVNSRSKRHWLRHALYYGLNVLSLKSSQTRTRSLPPWVRVTEIIKFESEYDGSWQRLPQHLVDALAQLQPSAVIKFGMGLLKVPQELQSPILSFHHGDPRSYRGRPAGFYELLNREKALGQVVQLLSNQLDSGSVVAFGETRVYPHSYRQTMTNAYATSPLLLASAVANALSGIRLPLEPTGWNYRLPSNSKVARLVSMLLAAKLRRWAYGAFFEKHWRVATAPLHGRRVVDLIGDFPKAAEWEEFACPPNYRFLADPFPRQDGGILAEGLRRQTGQGEILQISDSANFVLCSGPGHFSYPCTTAQGGDVLLLPEVSEWSVPIVYRLTTSAAELVGELKIDHCPRLKDATLFLGPDGDVFLFGNRSEEGVSVLRLWVAPSVLGRFREHPMSPIRLSPLGSRMAGSFFQQTGRFFRVGQNCARDYGNGAILFEVTELSSTRYAETMVGEFRFNHVKGPHTLNFWNNQIFFDFYDDRFSLTAGWRRLAAELRRRSAAQSIT